MHRWTLFVLLGCVGEKLDSGAEAVDRDGDGFAADVDCNDLDPAISPAVTEVCNGLDDDCDTRIDDDALDTMLWYKDFDGDGYGASSMQSCSQPEGYTPLSGDCNDNLATINPSAPEVCDDADTDEDCDGLIDDADHDATGLTTWHADSDSDGFGAEADVYVSCDAPTRYVADGSDCDDFNADVNPDATELCDDADTDEDCDGRADDNDPDVAGLSAYAWDVDGDGFGDPSALVEVCDQQAGMVDDLTDCDDSQAAINPAATELCDTAGADEDCDGLINDADPDMGGGGTYYTDADGDGFGDSNSVVAACSSGAGITSVSGDCDDSSAGVNPGATEACDGSGVDEDCDGLADDADPSATGLATWYADGDGDGYGSASTTTACAAPSGYVANAGDCDDARGDVSPGATEVCDDADTDEDCDGAADDADLSATGLATWYADADDDGFGDPTTSANSCANADGYVADSTDCDDSQAAINPLAPEICDGVDQDCDGVLDEDATDAPIWYADADGDGYGDPLSAIGVCGDTTGYTADSSDCDDSNAAIHPDATEDCATAADDDCDGLTQATDALNCTLWYGDDDADGFGDSAQVVCACEADESHPISDGDAAMDCDDSNAAIHPDAAEDCATAADDDCDGLTDAVDAAGCSDWYQDSDGDGYGTDATQCTCGPQDLYTTTMGDDCDDSAPTVYPGATEVCDDADLDEDCDGAADNADSDLSDGGIWHPDTDGDGYGDGGSDLGACEATEGMVENGDDCDDQDAAINPAAVEDCATDADDNCDGLTDAEDAANCTSWYLDTDGDGVGTWSSTCSCVAPAGYTSTVAGDCYPNDASQSEPGTPPTLVSGMWSLGGRVPADDLYSIVSAPDGYPIYLGSSMAGSWRADDSSLNWQQLHTLYSHTYTELAIDPDDPMVLFRSDGGQLKRSDDGGYNWTELGLGNLGGGGEVVMVYGLGVALPYMYGLDQQGKTYLSTDEGVTFTEMGQAYIAPSANTWTGPYRILPPLTPGGPVHLVADGILYRSTDNMMNWEVVRTDVPHPFSLAWVGEELYVGTEEGYSVSWDEGDTWVDQPFDYPVYFTAYSEEGDWVALASRDQISVDGVIYDMPNTATALAVSGERLLMTYASAFEYSDDFGATWVSTGNTYDDGMSVLTAHPYCDNKVITASRCSGGVFFSEDFGDTWSSVAVHFHYVMSVHYDPFNADRIWVVSDENLLRSDDGGESFDLVESAYHFHGFAVDPSDPDHVLLGSVGEGEHADSSGNVYASYDGGTTWENSSTGIPTNTSSAHTIMFWPGNPDVVLAGYYRGDGMSHAGGEGIGLYRSEDGGISWEVADLPEEDIAWLEEGPDGSIWAATGDGLWYSTDEGVTWTQSGPSGFFLTVRFEGDIGLAYEQTTRVYKTVDGGATWVEISNGLMPARGTWLAQVDISADENVGYVTLFNYGIYRFPL